MCKTQIVKDDATVTVQDGQNIEVEAKHAWIKINGDALVSAYDGKSYRPMTVWAGDVTQVSVLIGGFYYIIHRDGRIESVRGDGDTTTRTVYDPENIGSLFDNRERA